MMVTPLPPLPLETYASSPSRRHARQDLCRFRAPRLKRVHLAIHSLRQTETCCLFQVLPIIYSPKISISIYIGLCTLGIVMLHDCMLFPEQPEAVYINFV